MNVHVYNGFLCASPTRLSGKSIARISEEEFCHDPASAERKRALITNVASVVGVAVFLLIPMIIIFIVYRLRIKLYTRFKFHPFDRDECDGEDMDFDVFLSCCSDDDWPHGNEIREQLEERGYRVSYPPRDFEFGQTICDNIYNAVVRSKRTVCLLTPHFLQRLDHCNMLLQIWPYFYTIGYWHHILSSVCLSVALCIVDSVQG